MKRINIKTLIQSSTQLHNNLLRTYYDYLEVKPKPIELTVLHSFVSQTEKSFGHYYTFNDYYFGYTIPQISKEFDLLRFGEKTIVNIELKSVEDLQKIEKQLKQNQYYLSFLGLEIFSYTYVSQTNKLYTLKNGNLVTENFPNLVNILRSQDVVEVDNINNLFDPSNYLVSPFNSTKQFIKGNYFLTDHQKAIKKNVMAVIDSFKVSSFISITGYAGTGKTLLTYDIVKEYLSLNKKVLVIQAGITNSGHYELQSKYHWEIIEAKLIGFYIRENKLNTYDLIVIDEVQRMYPSQLDLIIDFVKSNNKSCVFSYDGRQCLRKNEINNNIPKMIADKTSSRVFNLSTKIRTNKEVATFILSLLKSKRPIEVMDRPNVSIQYFNGYNDAKTAMNELKENDWKIINLTPSTSHKYPYTNFKIDGEDSAHQVIGQEFDKVVATIDSYFYYNSKNELSTRGYKVKPYYHPTKMLSQVMTRTRKKLHVIIINNPIVLERCLKILSTK